MQSPGSNSSDRFPSSQRSSKEVSTAAAMVENLARLAAGGSVRLMTAADQVAAQQQQQQQQQGAVPERVMFSTIGLGIVPNFRRSETMSSGDDATDAACKALSDALERGSFWSFVSHNAASSLSQTTNNNTSSSSSSAAAPPPQVQLSVRLGVPTKQSQPQELMQVDQHRILSQLSTLQRQHGGGNTNGGGAVAMELLHVDLTVGGLWAQHDSSGAGTLAVVASVSVVQQQPTPTQQPRRSSFSRLSPAAVAQQALPESPRGVASAHHPSSVSVPKKSSPQARISRRAAEQEARQQELALSTSVSDVSKATAAWHEANTSSPAPRSAPTSPQLSAYSQAAATAAVAEQQLRLSPQRQPSHSHAEATAAAMATQRAAAQELMHRSSSMDVLAHISAELRDQQQRREEEEQQILLEQQEQPDDEDEYDGDVMDTTPASNAMAAAAVPSSQLSQTGDDQADSAYGDKYGNNTNYKKLPPGKTPKNNKRLFVKHSYQDFSREVASSAEIQQGETSKTVNAAFPLKLHETLSEIERDGHDDIVGWLAHGRSFKIHKQQEFVQLILPKYFVMTKKSSFLRQLNLYGFNRLSGVGPDQASYYHEKFLRGMKFLCRRMQRIKVNGNRIRAAGNPDEEPDLSSFPSCPPQASPPVAAVAAVPAPSLAAAHHDLATAAVLQFMAKQQQQHHQSYAQPPPGAPAPNAALSSLLALLPTVGPPAPSALLLGTSMSPAAAAAALLTRRRSFSENPPPPPEPVAKTGRSPSLSSAEDSTTAGNNNNTNSSGNSNTGGVAANNAMVSFPLKLQRILDKLESEGNSSVVSWLPHGRAFMVHNPDRFVNELMPLYFNQTKYSSFQRQLHMYNFQRITTGRDKGAYHHGQFQRGQPALCQTMQRTRVNGKGTRQPGNPQAEPDFYQLTPLARIPLGSVVEIPTQVVFPSSAIPAPPAAHSLSAAYAAPSVSSSSAAAESEEEGY